MIRLLWVLGGGLLLYFAVVYQPRSTLEVGAPAPTFALPARDGRLIRLEDFRGRVVLVNFWATWCAPCTTEMPSLNRLAAHFSGRPFQLIGISEDGESGAGWSPIDGYLRQVPVDFLLLLDPDGRVADAYGTFTIPESYLIDPQGRVVRKTRGAIAWDSAEIIRAIEDLMATAPLHKTPLN